MIFFNFFILGTLTSLIYPPFFFLPLGLIIFPLIIYLLSNKLREKSYVKYFFFGFSFGFGFLLIYLLWIVNPFLVFESTRPFAILSLFLPLFLSIFFGLGFLLYRNIKRPIGLILFTPFIFILIEFLISKLLYGFPWISNSLILSNNLFGFLIIKYFGTYSSGFLILSIFLLPTIIYFRNSIISFRRLIIIIYSSFILILLVTFVFSPSNNKKIYKEISIEGFQILSPVEHKNKQKTKQDIFNLINDSDSDYIIFGENNFPYLIDKNDHNKMTNFINNQKNIIIGATTYKDNNYYNSFLFFEQGKVHFFDKKILVPFGEFLPFRKYLKFIEPISGNIDFKSGKNERILITDDNIKILPIICYEIIFDNIFKNINNKKIDFIVNITNDSWFGDKIGPYQHFYITRIKSLIANRPIIRVSNNGISAIIDQNGNIIKSTKLNRRESLKYNLKINNDMSYIKVHKYFSYYLIFIFIIVFIIVRYNSNE